VGDPVVELPDIDDVRAAARRIAPHVHRTPVQTSGTLDRELGARVFFKCENLQKVGAFKARGATNAVLCLEDAVAARGVVTHSSGNHAAALAFAAGIRRIPCTVVMPKDAPSIKVEAVRGYGAEIVFCDRAERESTCERVRLERGSTFIHPYENPDVIPGQGTAALELWEEAGPLDVVLAPVGGGGLLAGTAITIRDASPEAEIWGAEPEAVDDAYRSLQSGTLQCAVADPETLADGLMTGLGRINFEILRAKGVRVETVTEQAIVDAARFVIERMKLVVEPSAATVLAVIRKRAETLRGKRIGAILSGGNTDLSWY
jgi:threonine dehydratase